MTWTLPPCETCGKRGRECNAKTCRRMAAMVAASARPPAGSCVRYSAAGGVGPCTAPSRASYSTLQVDGTKGGVDKSAVDGREGRSGRAMIDKATRDWLDAVRKSGAKPDQVAAIEAEINETLGRHFAAAEQEGEEDDIACGPAEMPKAKPLAASAPTRSMTARTSRPALAVWRAPRAKAPPKPAHPVPEVAAFASVGPEWLAEAARLHGLYMASPPWVRREPFGSYLATQIGPKMRKRIEALEAEVAEARTGGPARTEEPAEVAAYSSRGAAALTEAARLARVYAASPLWLRSKTTLGEYLAVQINNFKARA